MKRRYKILGGIIGFLAVLFGAFALVASHNYLAPRRNRRQRNKR